MLRYLKTVKGNEKAVAKLERRAIDMEDRLAVLQHSSARAARLEERTVGRAYRAR